MHRDGFFSRELLKAVSQELLRLIENICSHLPPSLLEVSYAADCSNGKTAIFTSILVNGYAQKLKKQFQHFFIYPLHVKKRIIMLKSFLKREC